MTASDSGSILTVNAKYVSYAHTLCASSAFIAALIVGVQLHYHKIVENASYGYPDEWFPSVSATIGDRYPERSIFQILIALTSGPRFLLLFLCYIRLYDESRPKLSTIGLLSGIVRTVTCGGWVYITSTDDHDAHDVFMIAYIVLTIPWEFYVVTSTPKRTSLRLYRWLTSIAFFAMLVPLVYFFIQHKVHDVPGSYSVYAYFEWSLIILDIAFDAWTACDFKDIDISLNTAKLDFTIKKVTPAATITKDGNSLKPKLKDNISFIEIVSNIINSFIYWSVLSGLFLAVWFFPLWNMGASGLEFSIITNTFPIILVVPIIKRFFNRFIKLPRVLCCLLGIGAYLVEAPEQRLFVISLGVAFGSIALANEISLLKGDYLRLKLYSVTFLSGLLLSSIAKFSHYSDNPIWPSLNPKIGGWNKTGLVVGLIGAALTPNFKSFTKLDTDNSNNSNFLVGLSSGSLLFLLHSMLSDSSTMISWVWDGYPVHGPLPVPHGAVSLIAFAIGIFVSYTKDFSQSKLKVFLFGCISTFILYIGTGWTGYVGSIGFTIFISIVTPIIFETSSRGNPALVFFVSGFTYIIMVLAHVWIVAYAFVPYGWILRERTDIVLLISITLLSFGIFKRNQSFDVRGSSTTKLKTILVSFSVISIVIAYLRFPFIDPKPHYPETRTFSAGIWTIHFGLDNDMWVSQGGIRDLVKDLELDIIGLLESDTQRIVMGNRDLTQQLAEELNMYADYGPGPNQHTWGCALLSKFPILNSTHHLLPSPVGELAPAIHATLDIYGELVDVVVFHSGQEEDVEDRRLQSLGVRDIMGSSDRPMVLLSYLVTDPLEGNYNTYVSEESGMHDIDPSDWDRWCQYILYKKLVRTGYARISRGTITDTEVQAGRFYVPKAGEQFSDAEFYSQERIDESQVEESLRFPSIFYGEGVREHFFHVFDEPRYFGLPTD